MIILAAALLVWIIGYTITDPSGGLVVIGVIVGLGAIGFLLNRYLEKRNARR